MQAVAFLTLHQVPHELPDPRSLSLTCVTGLFERHATHWFVVTRYEGHADPTENGLNVTCMPKRGVTRARVLAAIKYSYVREGSGSDSTAPFIQL